jgi:sugar phosphate isomerase/epimerase
MSATRRSFLKAGSVAAAGAALAPLSTSAGTPRPNAGRRLETSMRLSLAAYSMRDALTAGDMDLFAFIDWCAELGLPGTELTSYYFEEDFEDAYLHALKRRAFSHGLAVSGTAVRNDFCRPPGPERDEDIEHVRQWIDHAAEFYAPHIRIFAGDLPDGVDTATGIGWVADAIVEVLEHAAARGVVLGLENHGGITARAADHLAIVEAVGDHPWFGVNLDTGNYRTDAYDELAMAAPYAVNVQVKHAVHRNDGSTAPTDMERIRDLLDAAGYSGWVVLEYEGENPRERIPEYLETMRRVFA